MIPSTLEGLLDIVVAALGEELTWRGFALPRLQDDLSSLWTGLVLASALFHAPHSSQSMQTFILFLSGCIDETFILGD